MKEKIQARIKRIEQEQEFYNSQIAIANYDPANPLVTHMRILIKHYQEEKEFLNELQDKLRQ